MKMKMKVGVEYFLFAQNERKYKLGNLLFQKVSLEPKKEEKLPSWKHASKVKHVIFPLSR